MAVTNDASQDTTQLRVDPVTLRLLVSATVSSSTSGVTTAVPGRKVVAVAGTAESLAATTTCKKVDIVAETDNTGIIVVGDSTVVAALATRKGVPLYAGDFYSLEIADPATLFLDTTVSGDGVTYVVYN